MVSCFFFRAGKVIFGEIDLLELLRREEIKGRFGGVLKNFQGKNCLLVWVGESVESFEQLLYMLKHRNQIRFGIPRKKKSGKL